MKFYQDETNEHVGMLLLLLVLPELVLAWTDDQNDPQYAMSAADLELLEKETVQKGRHFTIHKLPIPASSSCNRRIYQATSEEGGRR